MLGCRVADEHDELHPPSSLHTVSMVSRLVLWYPRPTGRFRWAGILASSRNGRPLAGIGQVDDHVVDAGLLDRGKDRAAWSMFL